MWFNRDWLLSKSDILKTFLSASDNEFSSSTIKIVFSELVETWHSCICVGRSMVALIKENFLGDIWCKNSRTRQPKGSNLQQIELLFLKYI